MMMAMATMMAMMMTLMMMTTMMTLMMTLMMIDTTTTTMMTLMMATDDGDYNYDDDDNGDYDDDRADIYMAVLTPTTGRISDPAAVAGVTTTGAIAEDRVAIAAGTMISMIGSGNGCVLRTEA